jgi:hypothetical protein
MNEEARPGERQKMKTAGRRDRPAVKLYFDRFCPIIKNLTPAQVGKLMAVIVEYVQTEAVPPIDDSMTAFAFEMLRPSLDFDGEAYEESCRQSKYAAYCKKMHKKGEDPLPYDEYLEILASRGTTDSNEPIRAVTDGNEQTPKQEQKRAQEQTRERPQERPQEQPGAQEQKQEDSKGERGGGLTMPRPLTEEEEQQRREEFRRKLEQFE